MGRKPPKNIGNAASAGTFDQMKIRFNFKFEFGRQDLELLVAMFKLIQQQYVTRWLRNRVLSHLLCKLALILGNFLF